MQDKIQIFTVTIFIWKLSCSVQFAAKHFQASAIATVTPKLTQTNENSFVRCAGKSLHGGRHLKCTSIGTQELNRLNVTNAVDLSMTPAI